jgi:glutaredoxin-related protein
LGDLAKIKDMGDALVKALPAGSVVETLEQRLKKLTNQSKVMLFMKGSPQQPQCGFSQRIVNLLNQYSAQGVEYGSFDIYKDE